MGNRFRRIDEFHPILLLKNLGYNLMSKKPSNVVK